MKVLIIIPAYNEEKNIEKVTDELINDYPQYDYIIINDGSTDKTSGICKKKNYNYIDIPVNTGLAGGFQTGMKYACRAGYDYALQFDGDGQHNAGYIPVMLEAMQKNDEDFVIGSRYVSGKQKINMRTLGGYILRTIMKMTTGKTFTDPTSGMRLFNRRLIKIMADSQDMGPEPDTLALLVRAGARYSEVQVTMNERTAGKSYLNISSSIRYMTRMIFSIILVQWFRKKPKLQENT